MKIVRKWKDGRVLMLVDGEEWAALSAAVVIAYDTLPPETPPEMAEAAGRLWAGTQGPASIAASENCPGCGAKPGEGVNPRCDDSRGCAYWRGDPDAVDDKHQLAALERATIRLKLREALTLMADLVAVARRLEPGDYYNIRAAQDRARRLLEEVAGLLA